MDYNVKRELFLPNILSPNIKYPIFAELGSSSMMEEFLHFIFSFAFFSFLSFVSLFCFVHLVFIWLLPFAFSFAGEMICMSEALFHHSSILLSKEWDSFLSSLLQSNHHKLHVKTYLFGKLGRVWVKKPFLVYSIYSTLDIISLQPYAIFSAVSDLFLSLFQPVSCFSI